MTGKVVGHLNIFVDNGILWSQKGGREPIALYDFIIIQGFWSYMEMKRASCWKTESHTDVEW